MYDEASKTLRCPKGLALVSPSKKELRHCLSGESLHALWKAFLFKQFVESLFYLFPSETDFGKPL